jgi:hypothetical protein
MTTTTELATTFDTTPRELRKFLRSEASGIESVGKGSRYALPSSKRDVTALGKRFTAWSEAKATKSTDEVEVPADDDSNA